MNRPLVALHFNVLQDVTILRPIARLAASMDVDILLLISPNFVKLDGDSHWQRELAFLAAATNARVMTYETLFDVLGRLTRRSGLCIAGSESNVFAHRGSHELFRVLPSTFRTATLQHGFECVGFLHNARHTATLGRDVRFAADIVVGWFRADRLRDVAASERSKLFVAGPPMLIDGPRGSPERRYDPDCGMMCENTHSVRFATVTLKTDFIDQAAALAARMHSLGRTLYLRPHPAGQFIKRSGYVLPPGMAVSDRPMYKTDLPRFAFAISAPSTVLFDFILADVPVALWGGRSLDAGNYAGLPGVDDAEECWQFAAASIAVRERLLVNQRRFLDNLGMPADVRQRYEALLAIANA